VTYYMTRHDSMAQAVNTYVELLTGTDGGTPGRIKVPDGKTRISQIISAIVVDGGVTVDIGSNFTLKLSGTALREAEQEIGVGGIGGTEVGTSVGNSLESYPADVQFVDIKVKAGSELILNGAYSGTDLGTPFMSITLGFD